MALLNLVIYPNKILRQKAEDITKITPEIKQLAEDMLETMYHYNGIGLAANQVNILKRLIVIDLQINDVRDPLILINPIIVSSSFEKIPEQEGCLSVPNMVADIFRSSSITVKYLDINNQEKSLSAQGLLAVCLQHEIDHLNGILFFDYLSPLKQTMLLKKYKKSLKESKD